MKKSKYVVTAINALTSDREAITLPRSKKVAMGMLSAANARYEACGEYAPYSRLRLQLYKVERKPSFTPVKSGLNECTDCKPV